MEDKTFLTVLGRNIKKARKNSGWRQEDIARECNFDKASISRMEGGVANPTVLTLKKLAVALKVDIRDFMEGYGESVK